MGKPFPKAWMNQFGDLPLLADPKFATKEYPDAIRNGVPPHLRRGGVGQVQRPKECHHRASLYTLAHVEEPGLRLVYGTTLGHIEYRKRGIPAYGGNRPYGAMDGTGVPRRPRPHSDL